MWRHFRGDFLLYAFSKVLVGGLSFLVLRLLTYALTPADYGAYALLFALSTVTSTITTSYLSNSIVRFMPVAIEKGRRRRFDVAVWHFSAPTIFFAFLFTALALAPMNMLGVLPLSTSRFLATLFSASAAACYQICIVYAYSSRQRRRFALLGVSQMLFFATGAFCLNFLPIEPVAGAILILGCSYALSVVLGGWRPLRWRISTLRIHADTFEALLRYGAPLVALNVAVQLNTYLDQFMLRALRGIEDVGLYSANYVVADKIIYSLASVTAVTAMPLIFREWEKGESDSAHQMIWRSIFVFLGMGMPVIIAMLIFGDSVMSLLTGDAFAPGRVIVPYVLFGAVLSGVAAILSDALAIRKKTLDIALCYFAALIINFVLDLLLIPSFGIMGCAYSTLVAYGCLVVIVTQRAHAIAGILYYIRPAIRAMLSG